MKFKQQRTFGLVMCALLTVIGAWLLLKEWDYSTLFFATASLLFLITVSMPQRLSYPTRLWEKLGHLLETINSYLILALLFFLLQTPTGVIARWFGHDPLNLSVKKTNSYWRKRGQAWDPKSFKDQF